MNPQRTTRRLMIGATALVAAAVLSQASLASAAPAEKEEGKGATSARGDLRDILQRDADALLPLGAPGVLAELQTPHGSLKVRSGEGNTTTGSPVPWNAKFRIGSLTKTFVSTTVLRLVGEKRLSLDDTVDHWLPGLVHGNGNDGRKVTVRQLLQHTSGIPEYVQGLDYMFTQEGFEKGRYDTVTSRQAVDLAMAYKPDFAPGTAWNYSNTNYALAGMIIEKVTGHTWQGEVRRQVVKPLGLRSTTLPGTRADVPGPHAIGYERFAGPDATPEDPKYGEPIDATRQNPSWGGAAGEIISTTGDTNRFLKAVVSGRLLKPAQLKEMKHTVATNDSFRSNWPGARYGLGLVWIPNSCGGSWAHGGDIMGYQTRNGVSPDGSRSVMVTINTDSFKRDAGVPAQAHDITATLIEDALCG